MEQSKDFLKLLGQEFKARRGRLSVKKMSEEADVAENTIRETERGRGNPNIGTLEKIAEFFDTTVLDLVARNLLKTRVTPGTMETPKDVLSHEEKVLGWEQAGGIRRMILPFFSVIHQTKIVASYIRKYGCYNYSPLGDPSARKTFAPEHTKVTEEFWDTIVKRKESFAQLGLSQEIASGPEIIRFAKGEGEFDGLSSKQRRDQLDHVIEIVSEPNLSSHTEIRVMEHLPIYIMIGLYGSSLVTIRGRGIYLEISDTETMMSFIRNFYYLWNQSLRGQALIDFLEKQREEYLK